MVNVLVSSALDRGQLVGLWLRLLYQAPLSTIFHLYRGGGSIGNVIIPQYILS